MKINRLILYTAQLDEQTTFYKDVLGFKLVERTADHSSFKIGSSILSFYFREVSTPYHFAFNIPSNQIVEALTWLKTRVEVLNDDMKEIQQFPDWNAEAIYFYDQDKNIVEFIARKNLRLESNTSFRPESLLCISEIGLPVNNMERTFHHINEVKKLPIYSGGFEDFCAAGDENGLFIIINKEKRRWFPTSDIPYSSYFRVEGDYNIEFTNGKINKI
jgi:catechol 2,3-dioxygenase-like lactoylglutathione lyase family enzyme